jgi:hypothetical protein
VATHRWNDQVVEHSDEICVLLQVAFDILEHTLHYMKTFHVDHDLSDGLLAVILLVILGTTLA